VLNKKMNEMAEVKRKLQGYKKYIILILPDIFIGNIF